MEKLELKHLACYLPYGLKVEVKCDGNTSIRKVIGYTNDHFKNHTECISDDGRVGLYPIVGNNENEHFKPILRPLSDLTKEIEVNGEKFVPIERIDKNNNLEILDCLNDKYFDFPDDIDLFPYWVVCLLLEWHFDVFGLIDKGLAIDINQLK